MNGIASRLSLVLLSLLSSSFAVDLGPVTPASQIDPAGGATLTYANPGFSVGMISFCGEAFSAKAPADLAAASGATILNFESASGFGSASQVLNADGTAFGSVSTVSPFSLADAVTGISTTTGHTVAVEWRTFDDRAEILGPPDATGGVFLVGDRAAHDTMTSGTQGLVSGPVWKNNVGGGAYFTFDQNLTDFGVTLNCHSGSPTEIVALFDADGALIGKFRVGIASGLANYIGIHSPTGLIRSVWVGENTAFNGLVIDDVSFVPAPAPAVSLSYSFAGASSTSGWSVPSTAVLTYGMSNLTMSVLPGSGGISTKIWRTISLPAGVYDISGTGGGSLLVQLQTTSWTAIPTGFLNLSASGTGRADRQRFIAPGGNLILVVQVPSATATGTIQALTISSATVTPYTYDTASMASLRPVPETVRGFLSGDCTGTASMASTFSDARTEWGANVIRLYLQPTTYAAHQGQSFWTAWPSFLNIVAQHVQEAEAAGLNVVVTFMEDPYSGTANAATRWTQPDFDNDLARMWRDMATKLLPYHSGIWGYDLLNEPLDTTQLPLPPRQWWPIAANLCATIRTVDPAVWLIYEPGPGDQFSGFNGLRPLPDPKVIYGGHCYYPLAFTSQGVHGAPTGIHYPGAISGVTWNATQISAQFAPADAFQSAWDVPMYVGEFSAVRTGPTPDTATYLHDVITVLEDRGWSWSYCAFRASDYWNLEKDTGGAAVTYPSLTDRGAAIKAGLGNND